MAANRLSPEILNRLFSLALLEATKDGNSSGESLNKKKMMLD
jgi:hypothetical protein